MVRELPRKGQGATQAYTVAAKEEGKSDWAPIRIAVSTEDLKDADKFCTKENEAKPGFRGKNSSRTKDDVLTSEMIKTIVDEIIPVAVKLHAERLLVQRVKTPFVVLPFAKKQGNCQYFKVPEAHQKTAGMTGADMVLYVAAGLNYGIWATTCEPTRGCGWCSTGGCSRWGNSTTHASGVQHQTIDVLMPLWG
ncbi:surface protease GP63 [Trypanosoma rangeli]|uniref:Leishmanolysin-like peptidase n=1 Tax=Trypanosoma rangeli TaxID=5698 RepID=A0A3R7NJR9_TRYRA|nr:surface protease GP63 [Trypanosoma rangeli]RNF07501.1 surface protease GP63 [Trypanosoma rangeli]|eukprot:RNF07501.1 surface protease GP63 [Trypanosoma rangeli]